VSRRLVVAAVTVLAVATSGCGIRGLNFVKDERVRIQAPRPNAEVRVPFDVRWTVEDFDVAGPDGGSFGVFVDREPPRPGRTLASLAEDDVVCKATAGCPDANYLASHRAYTTTGTSFRVEQLPELTRDRQREAHEVTVVLLDGEGRRIGESAFRVEFHVRRDVRR
jgi:hypothetical protein